MSAEEQREEQDQPDSLSKLERQRYEDFDEFFKSQPDKATAAIVMQPVPDPDALGSALGVQWLMEVKYGITSDIFSVNDVSHPQNQTAVNVLDIRVKDQHHMDPEKYDIFIVVDTVPQNTGFADVIPHFHVVIDHHKFEIETDFVDIRPLGSCSTMVWEYLDHFDFDFSSERGQQIATSLLFGIRNDTGGLLSEDTSQVDMTAHSQLMAFVDRNKLHEITHYSIPSYIYELRSKAASDKVVRESVLISPLGMLSPKKRDALPIIADEFLRMEGIETVVVFSIIGDSVEASVRSHNSSVNVHDFCQQVFGPDHAGGKSGAGGASVPMGFLYNQSDAEELRNEICDAAQKVITQRILDYLLG